MNFTSKNPSKQDTLNAMMREIQRRKADYAKTTAAEVVKARQDLIAAWRAAHPDAAKEAPSAGHRPLDIDLPGKQPDDAEHPEVWNNDTYQVTVRRWTKDPVFGTDGGMIQIGINALDGTARHDWRDFQGIKNQIAGPECEAFELYPAESRLLDPSNYYTLWCFPGLKRIKVGHDKRRVLPADEALAPQRAFEVDAH
jgi:hypothetical protein